MNLRGGELGRPAGMFHVDSALVAAVATKTWSGLAGIVTLVLIARELTALEQGYYYAFWSLIALQSFAELGLLIVIVAVTSHEWAHLQLDHAGYLQGPARHLARFSHLVRFVAVWFACLAALFAMLAGSAGYVFLARAGHAEVSWQAPWLCAIVLAAAALLLNSLLSLLEGCNQVRQVNRLRLAQSVGSGVVLWLALANQWSLWSVPAMLATSLLIGGVYVGVQYRRLLQSVIRSRGASDFSWKADVWPMQWPLALQGVAAYFMFSLFVPVTFAYSGAAAAGRIGMAVQIGTALAGIASTWILVRVPQLGIEYARGNVDGFRPLWRNSSLMSIATVLAGSAAAVALTLILRWYDSPFMNRLPAPMTTTLLLAWICVGQIVLCLATYWRAMKTELTGPWGAIPGLATGLAVWLGGRWFGDVGVAAGALLVAVALTLPLACMYWRRARVVLLNSIGGGAR